MLSVCTCLFVTQNYVKEIAASDEACFMTGKSANADKSVQTLRLHAS